MIKEYHRKTNVILRRKLKHVLGHVVVVVEVVIFASFTP